MEDRDRGIGEREMGKGVTGAQLRELQKHLRSLEGKKSLLVATTRLIAGSSNPEVVGAPVFDCLL